MSGADSLPASELAAAAVQGLLDRGESYGSAYYAQAAAVIADALLARAPK